MKVRLLSTVAVLALSAGLQPGSATVGGGPPPPTCDATTCTTGDVTLDTTGTGTTTVGSDVNPGTLEILPGATYSTGTLDVAPFAPSNPGTISVTVDTGATLNDDAIVGDGGTATYTNNGAHNVTGQLILGNQLTGNGTYTITGDSSQTTVSFATPAETPNGALIVGNAGTGAFYQGTSADSGDTTFPAVSVAGVVVLGSQSGSQGTYTLTYGALTAGGDTTTGNDTSGAGIIVGDAGAGTFTQTGGSVTSGVAGSNRGDLLIGAQSTANGAYTLGATGQSTIPSLEVYGDITIGRDSASNGNTTADLSGSGPTNPNLVIAGDGTTLNVNQYTGFDSHNGGNLLVGLSGTGAVTQTDMSTVYLDHNLVLGANSTAVGSYTLNATSIGGSPPPPGSPSTSYNLFVGSDLDIAGMQTDTYGSNFQTTTNGGTGAFNLNSGDVYVVGDVNVGNNGGTGYLNVNGGTLTTQSGMNVGYNNGSGSNAATGTVTQTGGTVTVGLGVNTANLNVGVTNNPGDGTAGYYTVTGNTSVLTVNGNADFGVSPGAPGTLTIGTGSDSPTVNINATPGNGDGDLTIGDAGNGNLTMNSGALTVANTIQIGVNGTGTVMQSGGAIMAGTVDLSVPAGSGSSTYTMTGGSLSTTADLNVGGASTGTAMFSQSTGAVNVGGDLNIGNSSNATYNLQQTGGATSTVAVTGAINIALATGWTGTLGEEGGSITAGSVTLGGVVGQVGGGTGTVNQGAGTFTVTGDVNVGYAGGTSLAPNTYTLAGVGTALSIGGSLDIGVLGGSYGVFNISSGLSSDPATLTFTNNGTNLVVGDYGNGTLNVGATGGVATDLNLQTTNTLLDIGRNTGGVGTVNLAAGSTLEDDVIVGDAGTGTFYNSGTHTVGTVGTPENEILGNQATGVGTYNNNGGTNTVNGNLVVGAAGTGYYYNGNGSTGASLTVNGSGLSGGNLDIGQSGTGTFVASDGSQATVQQVLVLGGPSQGETTGSGTLTVTDLSYSGGSPFGPSAGVQTLFTVQGQTQVGGFGTGVLNIENGAYFESDATGSPSGTSAVIAYASGGTPCDSATGATGCVTVDGSDSVAGTTSEWNNTGGLKIGGSGAGGPGPGTGELTISNGGLVIDNADTSGVAASVGYAAGSTGYVTVETGSTWTNNGNLNVGDAGTGTVTVDATSTVTVTGILDLGTQSTGNGTFNLNGATFTTSETHVGDAGTGVFNNTGGNHTVTSYLVVGQQTGSTGQYTLDGAGSLTVGSVSVGAAADIGALGQGTFTQTAVSGNTTTIYGALDVGRFAGGTGTLNLEGGSFTVEPGAVGSPSEYGGFAVVGDSGTGTVYQSGSSTMTIGPFGLAIGRGESNAGGGAPITGTGYYYLSDTAQLNVTGGIALGFLAGNTGTFTQTGGSVNTDIEYVGLEGVGDWSQSAGANTTASLSIGNNTGGTGTYELSGGATLSGGAEYVGAAGNGTLTQTGGSNSATSLTIANNAGGTGLYTLKAGTLTNSGLTFLGGDTGAQGAFTQTGGSATLSGDVFVGVVAGPVSTISLGGTGAMTLGGGLDLGFSSGANGAFNFNTAPGDSATLAFTTPFSTLTVGDAGNGTFNQGGGDLNLYGEGVTLTIGSQAGSNGAYNLTGGTLEDDLVVGDAGTGAFSNSGGVHTVHGNLVVGNQATGVGTYTLGGSGNLTLADSGAQITLGNAAGAVGTFNYNTAPGDSGKITFGSGQSIIVGLNGQGTFNQGGGDLNLNASGVSLDIAQGATSNGLYALSGGTLETSGGLKVGDGGTGVFNLSGTGGATVNGDLVMGSQSTGPGTAFGQFNQGGGTLTVTGGLTVGDAGYGQFNQSGGTATVDGNLVVGNQASTNSSFVSVSPGSGGTASLTVDGNAQIGNGNYGSFGMGLGATVDIKGSMTIGTVAAATGGVAIEGGSLTVGDGGSGNELLVNTGSGIKIEDTAGVGAQVTVDGDVVNNGEFELGLHTGVSPATTLTVTGTLTNNDSFNFEGNAVLNANVVNNDYFSAQNGAGADVTLNGNMDNHSLVNVSQIGNTAATFTQNGNFKNEIGATLSVSGSNLSITGTGGYALDNFGAVSVTQDVNGPSAPISTVAITGDVKNESTGTITFQDAHVTVTGNVDNANSLSILGYVANIQAPSLVTVNGTTTNEAGATITVSKSVVTWNGTFTNNGAYHSDPSSQTFTDLNIGGSGYLTGGAGDLFNVTGNLSSTSTQNALWNTTGAELEFSGGGGHTLQLTGLDIGATLAGFTDNFAWGLLALGTGNDLTLTGGVGVNALYVSTLSGLDFSGLDVTNIFGDGLNIYYNGSLDPALGGLTYSLADGGELIPIGSAPPAIPEPSTWALLGVGFAGLAGMAGWRRRAALAAAPAS